MHYSADVRRSPAGPILPQPALPSASPEATLRELGDRVRAIRESKGWTRTDLARRSGISVRFLARIESGDGNVSILRLGDLARALDTAPHRLLRPEPRAGALVTLVGMRGAGKSTVGPILARILDVPFVEVDARIREAAGIPLDQLFELHGEAYYRRLEREALARILAEGRPAVLAASGGVVNDPTTWQGLLDESTVVWLRATADDHWNRVVAQGDRRPMADLPDAKAELRAMLAAREPLYRQADLSVDTTERTPREVAETIVGRIAPRAEGASR